MRAQLEQIVFSFGNHLHNSCRIRSIESTRQERNQLGKVPNYRLFVLLMVGKQFLHKVIELLQIVIYVGLQFHMTYRKVPN